MGLDVSGIGAAVTGVKDILKMFFPDKTEEELAKMNQAFQMIQNQTDIDKAEAQSTDPLQHWRGGAGWVCVAALAWTFVLSPMVAAGCALAHARVAMPALDMSQLMDLMLGMLGLGGLHVYQSVKKAS